MSPDPTRRLSRRDLLRRGAGLALSLPLGAPLVLGAEKNAKLRVGCIGVGGMGHKDLQEIAKHPRVEIVALCDVDQHHLIEAWKEFPDAKPHEDWRELLERKDVDAVTVSTPDHTHAPATMTALRSGKHVYCQKPLAHSVHEARQIRLAARESGLVTQMGIQGHSESGYPNLVDWIRGGVIGKIVEVHAWSDRPGTLWPQGSELRRLERTDPVASCFAWDLWLGAAPQRSFVQALYHPFNWRGWLDFGTGAQGDMGCHIMDPIMWALDLAAPKKLLSHGPKPNGHTYPAWSTIEYTFPGNARTVDKTLRVTWYDGGKQPPDGLAPLPPGRALPKNGQLFIGQKGVLLGQPGKQPELLPGEKFAGVSLPGREDRSHWAEWCNACLGTGSTSASFDYSGRLTETVLLGNVALRFPNVELHWDSEALRFPNATEADSFIKREYRDGWAVPGLS